MSLETVFMRGGNLRKLCEIGDEAGNTHTIEPYGIFTSGKNRRCLYYYLVSSSIPETPEGWKTEEVRRLTGCKLTEQGFAPRIDYDPFDKHEFPIMHYSIPTHDGRQRWMDKPTEDRHSEKLKADF